MLIHAALWLAPLVQMAAPPASVLVMPLEAKAGVSRDLTEQVTLALVTQVAKQTQGNVVAYAELQAAMSQELAKQAAGCNATSCAAELAGALDADEVVLGTLGRVGKSLVLNLSRISARKAVVLNRASAQFPAAQQESILSGLPTLAAVLFPNAPAASSPAATVRPLGPRGFKEPVSPDAEAAQLFAQAMQRCWDGLAFKQAFKLALEKDPTMAASALRLALWQLSSEPDAARANFATAVRHRTRLSERDLGLLEASRPYLKDPADVPDWTRRLTALNQKFPQDPEVLLFLGLAHMQEFHGPQALTTLRAAVAADPTFAPAWWLLTSAMREDVEDADSLAVLDDCVAATPYGTVCTGQRAMVLSHMGRCRDAELAARQLIANDPAAPGGYDALAQALASQRAPSAAVAEVLKQRRQRVLFDREYEEAHDQKRLAVWSGDFAAAEQALLRMQAIREGNQSWATLGPIVDELLELYAETGNTEKVCKLAGDTLARADAWTQPTFHGDGENRLRLQVMQVSHGCISPQEFAQARKSFLDLDRGAKPAGISDERVRFWVWFNAYARAANNRERALEAIKMRETMGALHEELNPESSVAATLGRMYLNAGQTKRALPLMERAAQGCSGFSLPWVTHLLGLGRTMEANGDDAAARAQYERVIQLWGAARPTSVTAAEARTRLEKLKASP